MPRTRLMYLPKYFKNSNHLHPWKQQNTSRYFNCESFGCPPRVYNLRNIHVDMACENASVQQYRDMYLRIEELDGLEVENVNDLHELDGKLKELSIREKYAPLLSREFIKLTSDKDNVKSGLRVMQWNILAQGLCSGADNFIKCPEEALSWDLRRFRIIEEILRVKPDVLCLQEVDHYGFIAQILEKVGYSGWFYPKVDSPALYSDNSNGPDGCAMFHFTKNLELINRDCVVLCESNGTPSNQVCIISTFKNYEDKLVSVATTHLKAKKGWAQLRHSQGSWLLSYLEKKYKDQALIVTGDFNGEYTEPVYEAFLNSPLSVSSTYALLSDDEKQEPPYTTFKIRGGKEGQDLVSCRTIDYMWFTNKLLKPLSLYSIPNDEAIGPNRLPSFQYPSDHFALAADYMFV